MSDIFCKGCDFYAGLVSRGLGNNDMWYACDAGITKKDFKGDDIKVDDPERLNRNNDCQYFKKRLPNCYECRNASVRFFGKDFCKINKDFRLKEHKECKYFKRLEWK